MLGSVIRALALALACANVATGGDGTVVMELVPRQCDALYRPQPTPYFQPTQIILAKGSLDTPRSRAMIDGICATYPQAEVTERLDQPHNRIDLGSGDPLTRHHIGKQTLLFGRHHSAVRQSDEQGNTCPNYWHFSPYGFCPYGCTYCYLAGTKGVWFSPTVKVFVNLEEILSQVDRAACRLRVPTAFYLGKLQDPLALDPLTGYSRTLIPFFAEHSTARLTLLTKSASVENLLDLDHRRHATLSWSLNPQPIWQQFEPATPPPTDRITAMARCAAAGYPVRAVIMPIIPHVDWRNAYQDLIGQLLTTVELDRITLGGLCSYDAALALTEAKLGPNSILSHALRRAPGKSSDGRRRYARSERIALYSHLIHAIRHQAPRTPISLCLEEQQVFDALGLLDSIGRCNCVL